MLAFLFKIHLWFAKRDYNLTQKIIDEKLKEIKNGKMLRETVFKPFHFLDWLIDEDRSTEEEIEDLNRRMALVPMGEREFKLFQEIQNLNSMKQRLIQSTIKQLIPLCEKVLPLLSDPEVISALKSSLPASVGGSEFDEVLQVAMKNFKSIHSRAFLKYTSS